MRLTNLTIRDLITPDSKLTFLAGAGCSIDPPSCLPAGRAMMDAIIDYTCAESEIKTIKELKDLRFEQLIEIVRDNLDPELKVIDFYGLCDKPNLQHFFLVEMIKNGQFVLTTNFDFLIEYALQHSGIPKEEIKIIITKEDFENFSNPQESYLSGVKTLYKIHGSTKNVLTSDPTRDSLIATIQAFGTNKEGENVFQLEPFKQPLFTNITKNRSLVVLGYSGSDDFDIVPTLRVLKHIQDVIWINFTQNDEGKEEIYEIFMEDFKNYQNLAKVDQILVDIKRMNYAKRVLRIDVNTTRMVKELIPTQTEISSDTFSINVHDWLENNLDVPSLITKYHISFRIYIDFSIYENAMHCSEKILQLAKKTQDKFWEATALNNIGIIYGAQGNYPEALKRYEKALQIDDQLGNLSGKATALNNTGLIYRTLGNYSEALKQFEEAVQINEQLGNLSKKATALNNIGGIHFAHGIYPEALKRIEQALQIAEQLGDLADKAGFLNNIGRIYKEQGNYPEALKRYEGALQIAEQLGDLSRKATFLNNTGTIYKLQRNYPEALKRFEEALQIDEQLGDLSKKATFLNNIGLIHYAQENFPKALDRYNEALQIDEQLKDLSGKAIRLNNIASIYYTQGDYLEALTYFQENLSIREQLKEAPNIALCFWWIGTIYGKLNDTSKAMRNFKSALEIYEQLGLENRIQQVREVISDLKSQRF